MRIKRIEADSVTEAMRELRRELGDHAIILHTKQVPARGVAAWFKAPRVEILGAVDEPGVGRTGMPPLADADNEVADIAAMLARPSVARASHPTVQREQHPAAATGHRSTAHPRSLEALAGAPAGAGREVTLAMTGFAERRARLDSPPRAETPVAAAPATVAAPVPPAREPRGGGRKSRKSAETPAAKAAAGAAGAPTTVDELVARATARQTARQDIADRLARFRSAMPLGPQGSPAPEPDAATSLVRLAPSAEGAADTGELLAGLGFAQADWSRAGRRARRIAFVGPTGAGKTTTLAKVAARAQLEHGRRIGIITIDTYRIGAVPQLQAYADILGAALAVAETPEALADALARMNDRDLVFIDTIGRSPLGGGVEGLTPFLAIAAADEIHLVLTAITRPADSLRAARAFARLVPNRLSVTKIDETDDRSALAIVSRSIGLPLMWLGTGQEVPDDLDAATPERLASLLATTAECPA